MEYTVTCDCGRISHVNAGDAGTTRSCECGANLQVPPLSELRESAIDPATEPKDMSEFGGIALFIFTIAIAVFASIKSLALVFVVGLLVILVSRLWFAMLILREMSPVNALLVLFVPFMPTIFFFQRLEITWKPFLYGMLGFVFLILGGSAMHR